MNCAYCGKVMHGDDPPKRPKGMKRVDFRPTIRAWHKDAATRDHINPRSRGGKAWVWACGACNADKQTMTLFEYRVVRSLRRGWPVVFDFEWAALRAIVRDICCTLSMWRLA